MLKRYGKKFTALLCAVALMLPMTACSDNEQAAVAERGELPHSTIGVSIWDTRDLMGSKTKRVIEATADALNVELIWFEHKHDANWVRTSVNKLCAAGCDGILFCPTEYSDMKEAIKTCDREEVYLAQYYSYIKEDAEPELYEQAINSEYYVGAVYEDEVENGYNLTRYLLENGDRKIGIMCGSGDDDTFANRKAGCELAITEWNNAYPDDTVVLSNPVLAKTSTGSCNRAVDELLYQMSDMDGLLVGSGSGAQVVGAMSALRDHGLTERVDLVGTGFLNDIKRQFKNESILAQSGGNICNPLYAFLLLYQAINGEYKRTVGEPAYEIQCSYIYISSPEEYDEYEKYFLATMPYSAEEIVDLAEYSPRDLAVAADILSVKDVKTRHSERYIEQERMKKQNAGINGKDNGKSAGSDRGTPLYPAL